MLLSYHRLLRIVEEACPLVLDEHSTARLLDLILDRIQCLELPAAVELEGRTRDPRLGQIVGVVASSKTSKLVYRPALHEHPAYAGG